MFQHLKVLIYLFDMRSEVLQSKMNFNVCAVYFQIGLGDLEDRVLKIEVYDAGKGNKNSCIGNIRYSFKDWNPMAKITTWDDLGKVGLSSNKSSSSSFRFTKPCNSLKVNFEKNNYFSNCKKVNILNLRMIEIFYLCEQSRDNSQSSFEI